MRRETAAKRGGGNVRGESIFVNTSGEVLAGIGDHCPQISTAELAECQRELLAALPNETLREIAIRRLEGFEVKEIAEKLSQSDPSIKRKLAIIRECWTQQAES